MRARSSCLEHVSRVGHGVAFSHLSLKNALPSSSHVLSNLPQTEFGLMSSLLPISTVRMPLTRVSKTFAGYRRRSFGDGPQTRGGGDFREAYLDEFGIEETVVWFDRNQAELVNGPPPGWPLIVDWPSITSTSSWGLGGGNSSCGPFFKKPLQCLCSLSLGI